MCISAYRERQKLALFAEELFPAIKPSLVRGIRKVVVVHECINVE